MHQRIGKCLIVLLFFIILCFGVSEETVISSDTETVAETEAPVKEEREEVAVYVEEETVEPLGKDELISTISELSTEEKIVTSSSEELLKTEAVSNVKKIQQQIYGEGRRVSFIMIDINSGEYVSSGTEHIYYGASVLKGPYVVAVNKYLPESVDAYIKETMTDAVELSDNQCYETLRMTYGVDVLSQMVEYTGVSTNVVSEYDWYPEMTVKDLAKLWVGMYWYFFEEPNENTEWCISIFENSAQSYISSSLCEEYTVYSKAGWIYDEYDIARNDGGIVMAGENPYILVIMSEAFDYYEDLEELAKGLDLVHENMVK